MVFDLWEVAWLTGRLNALHDVLADGTSNCDLKKDCIICYLIQVMERVRTE